MMGIFSIISDRSYNDLNYIVLKTYKSVTECLEIVQKCVNEKKGSV